MSIEPLELITSDSKSNTLLSELICRVLLKYITSAHAPLDFLDFDDLFSVLDLESEVQGLNTH